MIGAVSASWIHGDAVGGTKWTPSSSATIETPSSGTVNIPATQVRRVKSTSSGFGPSSSEGSSGSSAIPHIGQVPGPSCRICGCIGQVQIAPGVASGCARAPPRKASGSARNLLRQPALQK
jgi:hypothetical protein